MPIQMANKLKCRIYIVRFRSRQTITVRKYFIAKTKIIDSHQKTDHWFCWMCERWNDVDVFKNLSFLRSSRPVKESRNILWKWSGWWVVNCKGSKYTIYSTDVVQSLTLWISIKDCRVNHEETINCTINGSYWKPQEDELLCEKQNVVQVVRLKIRCPIYGNVTGIPLQQLISFLKWLLRSTFPARVYSWDEICPPPLRYARMKSNNHDCTRSLSLTNTFSKCGL